MAGKPGRSGGPRPGSGRPMGAKNFRYKTSAELIEAARIDENIIPVRFEGDSLEFLRATMSGKIWPTREQIYAAKSLLPIEHPPAITLDGHNVDEIKQAAVAEYKAEHERLAEEAGEKLLDELRRIRMARREDKPLTKRIRERVEDELVDVEAGEELTDDDKLLIGEILALVEQRRPEAARAVPISAILPPPERQLPEPRSAPRVEPIAVVVFSRPFSQFQVSSGRRFTAAEDGSITVTDEDDVEDLLRAGCRRVGSASCACRRSRSRKTASA